MKDRDRVFLSPTPQICDYFITAYRFRKNPFIGDKFYEIIRCGEPILSVFNLKRKISSVINEKNLVYDRIETFEENPKPRGKIIEMKGRSSDSNSLNKSMQNYVEEIRSDDQFACEMIDTIPSKVKSPEIENFLLISFWAYSKQYYEFQVMTKTINNNNEVSNTFEQIVKLNQKDKWIKVETRILLPTLNPTDEIIQTYISNIHQLHFYIDDIEIKLYSVPKSEVKETIAEDLN